MSSTLLQHPFNCSFSYLCNKAVHDVALALLTVLIVGMLEVWCPPVCIDLVVGGWRNKTPRVVAYIMVAAEARPLAACDKLVIAVKVNVCTVDCLKHCKLGMDFGLGGASILLKYAIAQLERRVKLV